MFFKELFKMLAMSFAIVLVLSVLITGCARKGVNNQGQEQQVQEQSQAQQGEEQVGDALIDSISNDLQSIDEDLTSDQELENMTQDLDVIS
ncbi:hypothetical protein J7L02_01820 [Candidatus Woesearchaeota archaeon]|nr:hypothetical protein [Candidatus Woesearchaeota archaeon]